MADTATSIDEYLDALRPEDRAELERIRSIVKRLFPDVEEKISYRMPTLAYKASRAGLLHCLEGASELLPVRVGDRGVRRPPAVAREPPRTTPQRWL